MQLFAKLYIITFLTLASCAHVTPVVVDCAKAVSPGILPAVETALVVKDYVAQLEALAIKYSLCVVNKAVAQLRGEAIQDKSFAAEDGLAQLKIDHAEIWLSTHQLP